MSIKSNIQKIQAALPVGTRLVAVSKFHPLSSIREAYAAGQRIFAESRPQELAAKVAEVAKIAEAAKSAESAESEKNPLEGLQWHFIGHLQTNKLSLVLPFVSLVESVDSLHLLEAINNWGIAHEKTIDVLLEAHIAREESKQGFSFEEIRVILSNRNLYERVRFRGLMAMASNTPDMEAVREEFAGLRDFFNTLQSPEFSELSIGMSNDWPIALECGSTMVRIGTAIFGAREY